MQEYGEFWERLEMEYEIEQLKNKKNEQTNEIKTEYKPIQTQMEGIPHKQTNEEWFCGLSTEDKAEAITDMIEECVEWNYGIRMNEVRNKIQRDYVVRWLKEKHNAE